MRCRVALFLLALAAGAGACEWDRDTLSEEASLGRDYLATIVGRFPRNPPLFYTMRRDRILGKRTKSGGDYDDLAVAFDKLGDPILARRWIERKPLGNAESRYRTLANRGTFLVHAWLAGKADRHDAEKGLENLREAVRLNPNAHFGREAVQIDLVKALLNPDRAEFHVSYEGPERVAAAEREAEGYAGIIRLGAGWESPDVFRAFAVSLSGAGRGALGQAAMLRARELERAGARPRLDPAVTFYLVEGLQEPKGFLADDTGVQFARLRREADAWQARRTAFMEARLRAGRHPDTDPTFWSGWSDSPPPSVRSGLWKVGGENLPPALAIGVVLLQGACVLVPVGALVGLGLALRRRWARLRSS